MQEKLAELSLSEVMSKDIGFWEAFQGYFVINILTAVAVAFMVFGQLFLLKRFVAFRPWHEFRSFITWGAGIAGVLMFLFVSPFSVVRAQGDLTAIQEAAALKNIQENIAADEIILKSLHETDDSYEMLIGYHVDDSPMDYEAKLSYVDSYGMMLPILSAEYDTLPVVEGSELESVLQDVA